MSLHVFRRIFIDWSFDPECIIPRTNRYHVASEFFGWDFCFLPLTCLSWLMMGEKPRTIHNALFIIALHPQSIKAGEANRAVNNFADAKKKQENLTISWFYPKNSLQYHKSVSINTFSYDTKLKTFNNIFHLSCSWACICMCVPVRVCVGKLTLHWDWIWYIEIWSVRIDFLHLAAGNSHLFNDIIPLSLIANKRIKCWPTMPLFLLLLEQHPVAAAAVVAVMAAYITYAKITTHARPH